MRNLRFAPAIAGLACGIVLLAGLSLASMPLMGQPGSAQAAPAFAPLQQGINAAGVVTTGQGTCFPDAVLMDCDGNITHQLKGPAGSSFFAPYMNQWVELNGAEGTCAGGTYLNVVTISPEQNPCPGGPNQQPTNTPPAPPGQATPTATIPVSNTNLGCLKPIQASSSQPGFPPEQAVDCNMATHWASESGRDPWRAAQNIQWIYVDLGQPQIVQTMRIHWGDQYHARTYGIYMYADWCGGWCHMGSTSRGNGGQDEWTAVQQVQGQQFMLYLVNPYYMGPLGRHYEIKEWEFFGSTAPAAGANLATSASSLSDAAGYPAANGVDGDVNTEWRSASGFPSWYYVDMGSEQDVNRAVLRWTSGMHASVYTLYAWNGANWAPIHTQRAGAGGDESVNFFTTRTRYVLLYATAGPGGNIGLREFEVYNSTTTPPNPNPGNPPAPPPPPPLMFEGGETSALPAFSGRPRVAAPPGAPQGLDLLRRDLWELGLNTIDPVGVLDLPVPGEAPAGGMLR